MDKLICPLLLAQHLSGGDLTKCRKEECAWYVLGQAKDPVTDKPRGQCAITAIAYKMASNR
jgi:hypothetical protein